MEVAGKPERGSPADILERLTAYVAAHPEELRAERVIDLTPPCDDLLPSKPSHR
jgi:hypothetical protein